MGKDGGDPRDLRADRARARLMLAVLCVPAALLAAQALLAGATPPGVPPADESEPPGLLRMVWGRRPSPVDPSAGYAAVVEERMPSAFRDSYLAGLTVREAAGGRVGRVAVSDGVDLYASVVWRLAGPVRILSPAEEPPAGSVLVTIAPAADRPAAVVVPATGGVSAARKGTR